MVSSEDYKCNFEFERRLNIIRGNSGVGKTSLAEIIMQQDIDVLIESTYPIQVVNVTNWRIIMENAVDSIILFDDLSVVETPEFAEVYKTFSIKNNNYFIIIARENISALKSTGRLPYSINAIYEMKADGVEHWLERIYDKQLLDLRTNNVESLTIF